MITPQLEGSGENDLFWLTVLAKVKARRRPDGHFDFRTILLEKALRVHPPDALASLSADPSYDPSFTPEDPMVASFHTFIDQARQTFGIPDFSTHTA